MALTKRRAVRPTKFINVELPGTAQQVYQGGLACWDTSTNLVAKGAASTTMVPIGTFAEDKLVASGGTVLIDLFDEVCATWMKNSAANACDVVGVYCYIEDDDTVRKTDNSNANSVAGRIWKIDASKGVLVQFRAPNGDRLGGLDA
jgi:hypothetical protein